MSDNEFVVRKYTTDDQPKLLFRVEPNRVVICAETIILEDLIFEIQEGRLEWISGKVKLSDNTSDLEELRAQWTALAEADTLHMLPTEALVASIKDLASELLNRTETKES